MLEKSAVEPLLDQAAEPWLKQTPPRVTTTSAVSSVLTEPFERSFGTGATPLIEALVCAQRVWNQTPKPPCLGSRDQIVFFRLPLLQLLGIAPDHALVLWVSNMEKSTGRLLLYMLVAATYLALFLAHWPDIQSTTLPWSMTQDYPVNRQPFELSAYTLAHIACICTENHLLLKSQIHTIRTLLFSTNTIRQQKT